MLKGFCKVLGILFRTTDYLFGQIVLACSGFVTAGPVCVSGKTRLRATDGGQARIGEGVVLSRFIEITVKYGKLELGAGCHVGPFSLICARDLISIGRDYLVAEYVTIRDQDHRFGPGQITFESGFTTAPVRIGDNVCIGAKATVLKGATIGDNVVVGANSVVTHDLPDNVMAAGVPARVIRKIGQHSTRE